jgi:hypothetical protein
MILRQPVPQRRRHKKCLLTITIEEVLSHPRIELNAPDGTVYATASTKSGQLPLADPMGGSRLEQKSGFRGRNGDEAAFGPPPPLGIPPVLDAVTGVGVISAQPGSPAEGLSFHAWRYGALRAPSLRVRRRRRR